MNLWIARCGLLLLGAGGAAAAEGSLSDLGGATDSLLASPDAAQRLTEAPPVQGLAGNPLVNLMASENSYRQISTSTWLRYVYGDQQGRDWLTRITPPEPLPRAPEGYSLASPLLVGVRSTDIVLVRGNSDLIQHRIPAFKQPLTASFIGEGIYKSEQYAIISQQRAAGGIPVGRVQVRLASKIVRPYRQSSSKVLFVWDVRTLECRSTKLSNRNALQLSHCT